MAASAGIVRADRLHRADDLPTKITSTGLAVTSGAMTIPEVERDKSLVDKLTEENAAILLGLSKAAAAAPHSMPAIAAKRSRPAIRRFSRARLVGPA